jgi:predicted nucleic acid-binding protein
MADRSCFIDTGVFFAAYNKRDLMHLDGSLALVACLLGWFGRAYTSTYVIEETMTLAKAKLGGPQAVKLADSILASKKIEKIGVDRNGDAFDDSLGLFKEHVDVRGLSFTDCTTLVLTDRMHIETLLSFDKGFKPFVPVLLGDGYNSLLSKQERGFLVKVAQRLGVKLKISLR